MTKLLLVATILFSGVMSFAENETGSSKMALFCKAPSVSSADSKAISKQVMELLQTQERIDAKIEALNANLGRLDSAGQNLVAQEVDDLRASKKECGRILKDLLISLYGQDGGVTD